MKILVVGNGGREHALAWKIAQSPRADRVFVAPGNAGTAVDAENVDIPATDVPRLVQFARDNAIDLTVVGPEAALAAGMVDAFSDAGLRAFGPSKAAAELEGSKVFCKEPAAPRRCADRRLPRVSQSAKAAITYLKDRDDVPVVVKADGLAAGKGVIVCDNREQALEAVDRIAAKQGIRRGRQSTRDRRAAARPRSQRAGAHRRPHADRHARLPGSQAGLRRRHRPEHRRHGRLLPDAARSPTRCWPRSRRKSSCPRSTR